MCRLLIFFLSISAWLIATDFYVSPDGKDDKSRDGKNSETAWASLAFACDNISEGVHTIHLAEGNYVVNKTAFLKSGFTVKGAGKDKSILTAKAGWKMTKEPQKHDVPAEYIIAAENKQKVEISHLGFRSDPKKPLTGAIFYKGVKVGQIHNVDIREFKWAGMALLHSHSLKIYLNTLHNASKEKSRWWNGLIRTRWIKHSEVYNNKITSDGGHGGYGYKGGGHENVKIYNNHIEVDSGFSIESAHENEYGLEIYNNYLNRCVSIPKGHNGDDPNKRNFKFTIWIHHNNMADSYGIEGPRNHLRISHNYANIKKDNGRFYTHHGGKNNGPIWIHHNVVENMDRSFVWMNEGFAGNISVYNNVVKAAVAGKRAGAFFGAYKGDRLAKWIVKNNVFIASPEEPRKLMVEERGVSAKIESSNNLLVNVSGPGKNIVADKADFNVAGDGPLSYQPLTDGNLVDAGLDIGNKFTGKAPDIGVYEQGTTLKIGIEK